MGSWDAHVRKIGNIGLTTSLDPPGSPRGVFQKKPLGMYRKIKDHTRREERGFRLSTHSFPVRADFFSPYLLTICFSDALGQDEDVNTYINGSTWSIGDCIDCYCHNGVISCSRTLSVITSNEESTDNCSQPDCDVTAFLKANRGICKGK